MKLLAAFVATGIIPLCVHALAPASSVTVGRLSERDDVLRAVDLLIGRIHKDELVKTNSSPQSLLRYDQFKMFSHQISDAVIVTSPHSASEHDSEKIPSQVSAPEDTTIEHGSPHRIPEIQLATDGNTLLDHLPPILEASLQLAAKAVVPLAAEPIADDQGTVVANKGPDRQLVMDSRDLLKHLSPILEASLQLAAKTDVPFAALPSTNAQSTVSANERPESQLSTDGHTLLEHLPPILESSFELAAKAEVSFALE